MTWYDKDSIATWALGPYFSSILFTFLVVVLAPILLHYFLYRPSAPSALPRFLVCGPSGAGKTMLVTTFERPDSADAQTHTSIDVRTIEATLPSSSVPGSARFRSKNDPTLKDLPRQKIVLVDTPGHSKLRSHALKHISSTTNSVPTGIVFVVDAADLSADSTAVVDSKSGLAEAAGYLHDVLLTIQMKQAAIKSSKRKDVQVLVAANKMDLFTALPVALVKRSLEVEIGRERESRAKGLQQGGDIDADARADADAEREPLGGVTEGPFTFDHMSEWGMEIEVIGGNLAGEEEVRNEQWRDWVARQL